MEEDKKNVIVVTWDFTRVSDYALAHAVRISIMMNYEIQLLHIMKSDDEAARQKLEKEMAAVCTKTTSESHVPCSPVIRSGSLFSTISTYASTANVQLVIMGTHGLSGSQRLFGSKALKVLVGSKAPFIVVQAPPRQNSRITNVVFPIDFKSESKEKVQWAVYIGKYFSAKIHIYKYPVNDADLQKKVNTNLNFAIRFLKQNNISYEIVNAPKSGNFNNETVKFAEKIQADMIIVSTTKDITMLDYMFGANEQHIIANSAKIPVMCMNPMAGFARVGQFLYG